MALTVTSPEFKEGRPIPKRFTADGFDYSPAINWSDVPEETQELAMICDDPDAPRAEPWVHWVVYKIPHSAKGLPEKTPPTETVPAPPGAMQGKNTWGTIGYRGPAPPPGHVHHYCFKVYALNATLEVEPGLDKKQLLAAMKGHIIAQGDIAGTYQRTLRRR